MKLSSQLVGIGLRTYRAKVSFRQISNFAAGLGETDDRCYDDERYGKVMAPPTFAVALTWPLVSRMSRHLSVAGIARMAWAGLQARNVSLLKGGDLAAFMRCMVHYEEGLQFFAPVFSGEQIVLRGTIVAVTPHDAGTLVQMAFDAETERGEKKFTEFTSALFRGVECADRGRVLRRPPEELDRHDDGGEPDEVLTLALPKLASFHYDAGSNMVAPIHTSAKFARKAGLPGVIMQGTATLGHVVRRLLEAEAGGDGRSLRVLSASFRDTVPLGETLRIELRRGARDGGSERELFFEVYGSSGQRCAIKRGYALLRAE